MKKILALVLALVLVFAFAACGSEETTTTTRETETTAETAAPVEEAAEETEEVTYTYVMMNIPYGEFFAAEYEGGDEIDAVSSATMNKPAVSGLTAMSYHTEDNSLILGVSYPVAVPSDVELDASLEAADVDSLYGAADYSYTVLDEEPAYYKTLSAENGVYSFSASTGEVTERSYESVELKTSSTWGEYEIDFDSSLSELTVFAGMLKTAEGNTYGLRVLENIWRGFEIGFTSDASFQDPHGSALMTAPYEGIAGQTITEIVYFTTDGIYSMSVDLYVPYKFENTVSVADAAVADGTTAVTLTGYPEDYELTYTVSSENLSCDGTAITWTDAFAGSYTLTVSDASGKYASYSRSFTLSTDTAAAKAEGEALVAADGASDEAFAAYIANITSVTVGENEVSASGRRSTKLILEDGTVDKTQASVFSAVGDYELVIHAAGYPDVTLNVTITEVAETQQSAQGGGH